MTINEVARATGWSARMLRYIERIGLVAPARTESGYRLYGTFELLRLHELNELLARFDLGLSEVAFAARMATNPELKDEPQGWLDDQQECPEDLITRLASLEQDGHERLLAATNPRSTHAQLMETP
jgi:DNA-binding transcriptional MerR regulator